VVVTKVRQLAMDANLSLEQFLAMETVIQQTWKSAGDALRIKFQAMPQGVALVCTGFVEVRTCMREELCGPSLDEMLEYGAAGASIYAVKQGDDEEILRTENVIMTAVFNFQFNP
jgi:hypothetical protein